MRFPFGSRKNRPLKRLNDDRSGMAMIYVTAMLPVIIGFSLLALDVGRVLTLQSSLQHGADSIALAMAGELDRGTDAIIRADRARDNLVSNPALFSSSIAVVDETSVDRRFLTALPASDNDPITAGFVTTNPALARFVEVTVRPASYTTIFPASFLGVSNTATASAVAVAGFDAGVCNITPMFICNPLEPAGNTDPFRTTELLNHVNTKSLRRRLIELKAFANSSGQSQWSPGNFGYLETPLGPGANALGEAIATAVPTACAVLNNITTKPGNVSAANDAFNVRFDMYGGSYKKDNSNYRPARNTRKSWIPAKNGANKECNPSEVADLYTPGVYSIGPPPKYPASMGFPRDACHVAGNCSSGFGGRLGGGDWNGMFELYMRTNFGTNTAAWPKQADGSNFTAGDLPTRYDVYRAEIRDSKVTATSMALPACYNGSTTPSDTPDRRLIFAAIANCIAQPIGSGSSNLKAIAFGQFFLTEPVGSQGSVYAEMIDVLKLGDQGGSNGVLITDNIQLYR